ncbi:hypothetical protein [Hyphomonas sp. KY3]|uniref:hypothetical protein n=1 Tax=Hyphomonas sp. KY3 TaxID=2016196 RepID=UPI001A8EFAE1|nr:hypothetical protein [Hyphomonas sp. KY3]QSR23094.1 hypothetical protein CFA77_12405 [Hyphomonas sp. KY3]
MNLALPLWPTQGLVDRLLAGIGHRLNLLTRRPHPVRHIPQHEFETLTQTPGPDICVTLPGSIAFAQSFNGRTRSDAELRKITANELARLSPLDPASCRTLAVRDAGSDNGVCLLHIRQDRLDGLEAQAGRLGIHHLFLASEAHPDWSFAAPASVSFKRRDRYLTALSLSAIIAGAALFLASAEHHLTDRLAESRAREAGLRAELLSRREQERETGALGELAALSPAQLAPGGRLTFLSNLSAAMPETAWWKRVELNGRVARITGEANSAPDALKALSSAFPEHRVRFDEAVSDTQDGKQAFVIEIAGGRE